MLINQTPLVPAQSAYLLTLSQQHLLPLLPSSLLPNSWNSVLNSAALMTPTSISQVLQTSLLEKGVMSEPFLSSPFT